jgi:hypothetical protein
LRTSLIDVWRESVREAAFSTIEEVRSILDREPPVDEIFDADEDGDRVVGEAVPEATGISDGGTGVSDEVDSDDAGASTGRALRASTGVSAEIDSIVGEAGTV